MYYIKIPLRRLVQPAQLHVPEDRQHAAWRDRVKGLLQDVRSGVIPSWAVDYEDLQAIELQEDES